MISDLTCGTLKLGRFGRNGCLKNPNCVIYIVDLGFQPQASVTELASVLMGPEPFRDVYRPWECSFSANVVIFACCIMCKRCRILTKRK
jgi:hypothetical protein